MKNSSLPDIRSAQPLYTVAEAARFLGVPASTFVTWAKGYDRRPVGRPGGAGARSSRASKRLRASRQCRSSGWPRGWCSRRSGVLE